MKKLYVYMDETGQDTQGDFFIVSVCIVEQKETIESLLEQIETHTGKKKLKWIQSEKSIRTHYLREIIRLPEMTKCLSYQIFLDVEDYLGCVVMCLVQSILDYAGEADYKATIIIDGLQKSVVHQIGAELRKRGVRTRKIRGDKDENSAFLRLADALCGFVRAVHEGKDRRLDHLMQKAKEEGVIREL